MLVKIDFSHIIAGQWGNSKFELNQVPYNQGEPAMGNLLDGLKLAQATFSAAENIGITDLHWERFRADEAFRKRVAEFIKNGGFQPDSSEEPASYGFKYAFGIKDWEVFSTVKVDIETMRLTNNWPWVGNYALSKASDNKGGKIVDTHFCFAGISSVNNQFEAYQHAPMPLDPSGLSKLANSWFHWQNRPKIDLHYEAEQSELDEVHNVVSDCWYLMPLATARGSLEEIEIEYPDYEVANMAEYLLMLTLYFQKYGELPRVRFAGGEYGPAKNVATAPFNGKQWVVKVEDRAKPYLRTDLIDAFPNNHILNYALKRKLPVRLH